MHVLGNIQKTGFKVLRPMGLMLNRKYEIFIGFKLVHLEWKSSKRCLVENVLAIHEEIVQRVTNSMPIISWGRRNYF